MAIEKLNTTIEMTNKDMKMDEPKQEKILNIYINRADVIRETSERVLIKINLQGKDYQLWVAKKFCFPSSFSLMMSIGLVPTFEYLIYELGERDYNKVYAKPTGKLLYDRLNFNPYNDKNTYK